MPYLALFLNPVTASGQDLAVAVVARSRADLEKVLVDERVEPYVDGQYHKVFRRGSLLEWYNPPLGELRIQEVPTRLELEETLTVKFAGYLTYRLDRWDGEVGRLFVSVSSSHPVGHEEG